MARAAAAPVARAAGRGPARGLRALAGRRPQRDGARAIAAWARGLGDGLPLDIVVALRSTKRAEPILAALAPVARSIVCAGNPADHLALAPARLAEAARAAGIADAREAADVAAGLRLLDAPRRVLVCGSLYLAGAVLAENG